MTGPSPGRSARTAVAVVLFAFVVAGCGIGAGTEVAGPTATPGQASISAVVADTRRQLAAALAPDGIQLIDARDPYAPPEPPSFAAAPRSVLQALLPAEPTHGHIVVYEFADTAAAGAAGRAMAAYLGSGFVRALFPPDAQHLLRQLGTTLVFYSWSPANASDPNAPRLFADLSTVGIPIDIPR